MKEVAWSEVCSTCLHVHVESRKGYCSPRLLIFRGTGVPFHVLLVFCFSPQLASCLFQLIRMGATCCVASITLSHFCNVLLVVHNGWSSLSPLWHPKRVGYKSK